MTHQLRLWFARFRADEAGMLSVETILMLPLLFWAYIGTFAYFDVFRQQTVTMNAAYTISDLVSREWVGVDDNYIDQMHRLQNYLTYSPNQTQLRLTIVCYDDTDEDYHVAWSEVRGSTLLNPHTETSLNAQHEMLPVFPEGDQLILVETWVDYIPLFNVGLQPSTNYNHVFTRPRFTNQVKLNDDDTKVCTPSSA